MTFKEHVLDWLYVIALVTVSCLGNAFVVLAEWIFAAARVAVRFAGRSGRRTFAIAVIVLSVVMAIKAIGEPGEPFTADSALRVLALVLFLLMIGFGAGREGARR